MKMFRQTGIVVGGLLVLSLSACDLNPINWAKSAKQKFDETIVAAPTAEEQAALEKRKNAVSKPITAPLECSADAALILCKNYPSVDVLLADPNVKNFGFKISVDEKQVKDGLAPALKYRLNKDGSVSRG